MFGKGALAAAMIIAFMTDVTATEQGSEYSNHNATCQSAAAGVWDSLSAWQIPDQDDNTISYGQRLSRYWMQDATHLFNDLVSTSGCYQSCMYVVDQERTADCKIVSEVPLELGICLTLPDISVYPLILFEPITQLNDSESAAGTMFSRIHLKIGEQQQIKTYESTRKLSSTARCFRQTGSPSPEHDTNVSRACDELKAQLIADVTHLMTADLRQTKVDARPLPKTRRLNVCLMRPEI